MASQRTVMSLFALLLFASSTCVFGADPVQTEGDCEPLITCNGSTYATGEAACGDTLLCEDGICVVCDKDGDGSDCVDSHGPMSICSENLKTSCTECRHKDIFPIRWLDIAVSLAMLIGGMAAAGGGVGGGGVFVPMLLLIGRFLPATAIPLSNSTIFGASVTNFFQNVRRRHPTANRPLIDYDLTLMLQPMALAGTVIGVLLNAVFPDWLTLILLILVLCYTSYRTVDKGLALLKKENLARSASKDNDSNEVLELNQETEGSSSSSAESAPSGSESDVNFPSDLDDHTISDARKLLEREQKTPFFRIFMLMIVLVLMSVTSLLRGGKGASPIGIKTCEGWFWVLLFLPLPLLCTMAFFLARMLNKEFELRSAVHYQWHEGDIEWSPKWTGAVAGVAFGAGVLASLLGIGGGMVISPVMLDLGVLPEVTAATSSFMILFTSASTVVQFIALGRVPLGYGLWFGFVGLLSSLLGQTVLNYLVQKYNRKSFIVFSISIVIGLSTILILITGLISFVDDIRAERDVGFSDLCEA